MSKVAIIFHSGFGHTKIQAEHVLKGAEEVNGTEAKLFEVESVTKEPEILNDYDALIFGAPTYMGSASAEFKAFMDATSRVWFTQAWKDKIAAGFTNSSNMSGDKLNTLIQFVTLASQHSMIWVSLGEMNESANEQRISGDPLAINRIGSYIGAMAQSDNAPADQTPPKGDLLTAKRLGSRVAEIANRLNSN